MARHAITVESLVRRLGTAAMPPLFDVRRQETFAAAADMIPSARWRDHRLAGQWAAELERGRARRGPAEGRGRAEGRSLTELEAPGSGRVGQSAVVVYCVHGHHVSQSAVALLRAAGLTAFYLEGGIEAWRAGGLPLVDRVAVERHVGANGSDWVTREAPRIDRIACPWLVRRFVDPGARIHYVAPDQVEAVATEIGGIPFDVPGVAFGHDGPRCSFDAFIRHFGLRDPALDRVAEIVRGADTGRPDLTPQCEGLLAITRGLGATISEDHLLLDRAMALYDGLYGWARMLETRSAA